MQKVLVIITILVSSIFIQVSESSNKVLVDSQLIGNFLDENDWDIAHFELIFHKVLSTEQYEEFKKIYKDPRSINDINERYNAVHLNDSSVKIIYSIEANNWSDTTQDLLKKRLNSDIFQQYMKNSKVYTCFQAEISDNISSNFIFNEIINNFGIETKNILDENGFKVISGSTIFFDQFIPLKDDKINIQVAIRELDNANKVVTIGTPILVIEY
ncbi:YwmB family TATA-box binding protein [Bacillaceae bacterium W0354]